jgi:hypothetical protein
MNNTSGLVVRKVRSKPVSKEAQILARFLKAQDRLVYQTADLSLGSLSGMSEKGDRKSAAIDLEPDFQRRKRWPAKKQSALIESFLLNIPVPPIYLAEDELGKYSIVDGKQRLTAIHAFMLSNLKLTGLESFTELEGMTFAQLPEALRNSLEIRPYVRVVTLLKQSDPLLKFEVFTRLNTGGAPMLPQELRKVAYRGELSDLIFSLSETPFLKKQLKITSVESSGYLHMEDAEFVLRFFALKKSWQTFSGSLRVELDKYMAENRNPSKLEIEKLKEDFLESIGMCQKIWGDNAFKRYTGSNWRSQFLSGMYDAEMIAVSELTSAQRTNLGSKADVIVEETSKLFDDSNFDKWVRQGTNTPSFVRNRINAVLKVLTTV